MDGIIATLLLSTSTLYYAALIRSSIQSLIFQSRTAVLPPLSALLLVVLFLLPLIHWRQPRSRKISLWVSNTARLLALRHRVLVHSLRRHGHRQIDHHTTTGSTQSSARFFDLPGELRNLVYHFAQVANGDIHAFLYQDASPALSHDALGLLRASRRLRAEAAPIIFRRNHFITTARHPFTKLLNDEWVSEITSLTLRADIGLFLRYDSLEHALAIEIPRLRNLVRLTIRFETVEGEYGPLDVAASIVACVSKMENLRFLELGGVQRAPETQLFADSIRGQLGDTILSWRGRHPGNQTVVIRGMAGPLRVVSGEAGARSRGRGMNLWRMLV